MTKEWDDLIVQVGIDEDLHELLLQSLLHLSHDRREGGLVLAQTLAAKARPQRQLHVWRSAESVPDSVGGRGRHVDGQRPLDGVQLQLKRDLLARDVLLDPLALRDLRHEVRL